VTWVGGPLEAILEDITEEVDAHLRKPPRPHIRAGHYRRVRCGPKGNQHLELRWIKPVHVGSWDRVHAWEQLKGKMLSPRMVRTAKEKIA